jgi:DNA-directed RNA polymerase specialized sigma24 family protein
MNAMALQQEAAAVTWEDMKDEVAQTVRKFVKKHGGDFEESMSEALILFMRAMNNWQKEDRSKTNFSLYLYRVIWFNLFDAYRTRTQHRRQNKVVFTAAVHPGLLVDSYAGRDVWGIVEEVGNDAATAMKLVLDMPAEIKAEAEARGGKPRNIRAVLRGYLVTQLGWDAKRIANAFEDVKHALGN